MCKSPGFSGCLRALSAEGRFPVKDPDAKEDMDEEWIR